MNGVVNKKNGRSWAPERPEEPNQVVVNSPGDMTWSAKSKDCKICPFLFDNVNVPGENDRNMLTHHTFPRFLLFQVDYNFQQYSALPHFTNPIGEYLNTNRPKNWIGRGGPVSWPLRSSNLTPCDSSLWEHLNQKIYSTPIASTEELKNNCSRVPWNQRRNFENDWTTPNCV